MSYSANRRDALDSTLPIAHRMSRARSCAMLMGQKYRVHLSAILDLVQPTCGVVLTAPASDPEIAQAIGALDRIKADGLGVAARDSA